MSAPSSAEAFLLFTRHVWGSKIDFFMKHILHFYFGCAVAAARFIPFAFFGLRYSGYHISFVHVFMLHLVTSIRVPLLYDAMAVHVL
jgi:hypothetical protein